MSASVRSLARLAPFVLVTLGGGMLIGISNPPGEWYAGLAKPGFTPPNWLFPIAWTVIYVLVAVAGWRVFEHGPAWGRWLWAAQLALNFSWSPTFFGAHRIGVGLVVIGSLLLVILAFMTVTRKANRAAFACFVPYAAWVAYASALNFAVWRLN